MLYTTPLCIEIDATKRSSGFGVSSANPEYRLILDQNYNMIHNTHGETLTTVDLSHNEIGNIGAQHLADALRNHQTLTTIDLCHNQIENNGMQYLYDAFKQKKTFLKLNLEGNPGSSCTAVSAAIQIRNDKVFTILELSYNEIGNNGMQYLYDAFKENKTLIKLNLKQNPSNYCTAVSAAIQIQNDKILTILGLSCNEIRNNGMQYLNDALKESKTLIKLNLDGNPGSYCTVVSAAIQIQNDKVLTILELAYNEIGNNGAQYLNDVFKENKTILELNLEGNPGSYCATVSAAIQIRNDKALVTLDLSFNGIGDIGAQQLFNTLETNTVLTTLNLSHNQIGSNGAQYLYDAFKENKTLIKLNLERNPGTYCTAVSAAIQIQNDKVLTILELSYNEIGNNGMQYLYDAFKENKTLIKLNLEGNPGTYCATVSAAIQIRNDKVLTILELSYNEIGNNGMQYLYDAFKENKTLIKLNLEENPGSYCAIVSAAIQIQNDKAITEMNLCEKSIDDIKMKFLADALINNKTIIELDLSQNTIGDIGIKHLADALQNNKTLTTLKLSNNQIGHIGAKYLCDLLQTNQIITVVDLSGNHIGDTGTQYLANVLQNNPTVTELNVSRSEVNDIGVQYLADMLRNNTTITSIGLSGNQIGDIGAKYLADALQNNGTLTTLILDSYYYFRYDDDDHDKKTDKISNIGAQFLADALKNNRVIYFLNLFCMFIDVYFS
ncbi:unnamed protein product [Adineta steineri]|uniref:Uncharacterized protein n=1 Tax=Adineta steineri TaxID=433720 RepID=A0A815PBZ1_9BILA|nr:unnamed protein product [Adineta steineri]